MREAWEQGMELSVHGWVYHVATAKLRDLGVGVCGGALPVPVFCRRGERNKALTLLFEVGIPTEPLMSRPSSYAGSESSSDMEEEVEEDENVAAGRPHEYHKHGGHGHHDNFGRRDA